MSIDLLTTSVVAIYYDYCYLTAIVTFIFVAACVWPPLLLPRIEYIETRDSSSRLTTPGPAALDLKLESSRGPANTDPSPPPPVAHRSTVPTKPRVEHAEGGSIATCYLHAKGKR